jgi:hypothetical protein
MFYAQSVEGDACTACGALITNSDLMAGVVGVIERTGLMRFHMRCFELSNGEGRVNGTSTEDQRGFK